MTSAPSSPTGFPCMDAAAMIDDPVLPGRRLIADKDVLERCRNDRKTSLLSMFPGLSYQEILSSFIYHGVPRKSKYTLKIPYEEFIRHWTTGDVSPSKLNEISGLNAGYLLTSMGVGRSAEAIERANKIAEAEREATRRRTWSKKTARGYLSGFDSATWLLDGHEESIDYVVKAKDESIKKAILVNGGEREPSKLSALRADLLAHGVPVLLVDRRQLDAESGDMRLFMGCWWASLRKPDPTITWRRADGGLTASTSAVDVTFDRDGSMAIHAEGLFNPRLLPSIIEAYFEQPESADSVTIDLAPDDWRIAPLMTAGLVPTIVGDGVTRFRVDRTPTDYADGTMVDLVRRCRRFLQSKAAEHGLELEDAASEQDCYELFSIGRCLIALQTIDHDRQNVRKSYQAVAQAAGNMRLWLVELTLCDVLNGRLERIIGRIMRMAVEDFEEIDPHGELDIDGDVFYVDGEKTGSFDMTVREDGTIELTSMAIDPIVSPDDAKTLIARVMARIAVEREIDVTCVIDYDLTGVPFQSISSTEFSGFDSYRAWSDRKSLRLESRYDDSDTLSMPVVSMAVVSNRSGSVYRMMGHPVDATPASMLEVIASRIPTRSGKPGYLPVATSTKPMVTSFSGYDRDEKTGLVELTRKSFDRAHEKGASESQFMKMAGSSAVDTHRAMSTLGASALKGTFYGIPDVPYEDLRRLKFDECKTSTEIARELGKPLDMVQSALLGYGLLFKMDDPRLRSMMSASATRQIKEFKEAHDGKTMHQVADPDGSKARATMEAKYGKGVTCAFQIPGVREKINATQASRLAELGVTNVFQLESVKAKIRETNLKKYGAEHPMQTEEFKRRVREQAEKQGYWPGLSPESLEKRRKTVLERYGVDSPYAIKAPAVQEKIARSLSAAGRGDSQEEKIILGMLANEGVDEAEIVKHDRSMLRNGRELDLLLPDHHLAFEVSPAFSHNENTSQVVHTMKPKAGDYHQSKWIDAAANDVDLVTLFDWNLTEDRLSKVVTETLAAHRVGSDVQRRGSGPRVAQTGSDERSLVIGNRLTDVSGHAVLIEPGDGFFSIMENHHIVGSVATRPADGDVTVTAINAPFKDVAVVLASLVDVAQNAGYSSLTYDLSNDIGMSSIVRERLSASGWSAVEEPPRRWCVSLKDPTDILTESDAKGMIEDKGIDGPLESAVDRLPTRNGRGRYLVISDTGWLRLSREL